ncbi:MAG TPA: hypothetical protein VJP78_05575, partial [Thermoleophilia bacterium]|nr:hypothetical protein [Thermoleophilia bacterium]
RVIRMHQNVAHPRHLPPWELRMESFEVIREALCRFTDDQQLPDYGILAHRVSEEFLVGDPPCA